MHMALAGDWSMAFGRRQSGVCACAIRFLVRIQQAGILGVREVEVFVYAGWNELVRCRKGLPIERCG